MKVVFLDIDGVLNSDIWNQSHKIEIDKGELIDEQKVILLSDVIKKTKAVIVLHSGWRFWLSENLVPIRKEADNLLRLLKKYEMVIYDKTPDLSTEEIRNTRKFSLIKAKEIMTWLEEHKEVEAYLVLDDLDLHNIEVLKDQLVGVDSTYFDMAMKAMEEKQEANPEWKVDNSYLFEVINKIF
jgi:hypothetical protein